MPRERDEQREKAPAQRQKTARERKREELQLVAELIRNLSLRRGHEDGEGVTVEAMVQDLKKEAPNARITRLVVRSAFELLEVEGLIVVDRRGTKLRIPSPSELHAVMTLRGAIESVAAKCLARKPDLVKRLKEVEIRQDSLRDLASQDDSSSVFDSFRKADAEFHQEIMRQADLKIGIKLLEFCRRQAAAALFKSSYVKGHRKIVVEEHDRIIKAIRLSRSQGAGVGGKDRWGKDIEEAVREHLTNAVTRSLGLESGVFF